MKRFISITLLFCIVMMSAVPVVAGDMLSLPAVITNRSINTTRYEAIHDELNTISSEIRRIENAGETVTRNVEYQALHTRFDSLIKELDLMGATLDDETLAELPAPATIPTRTLPDNLADLENYYTNWFNFSGYEETVTVGNESYRAYIVTVRDKVGNGGLLTSVYNDVEIITENEAARANTFNEIVSTAFQYAADGISSALSLGNIGTWITSQLFSGLVYAINSGTITIQNSNTLFYELKIGLETNLTYVYVWDESTSAWVYCLSSGRVFVDEDHTLNYYEFVGGSGSQYDWNKETTSRSYSIIPYPINNLSSTAVGLYTSNGNSAPAFNTSYQIGELNLKRRWGSSGNYSSRENYNPVSCVRPGDLWTLGSLVG